MSDLLKRNIQLFLFRNSFHGRTECPSKDNGNLEIIIPQLYENNVSNHASSHVGEVWRHILSKWEIM